MKNYFILLFGLAVALFVYFLFLDYRNEVHSLAAKVQRMDSVIQAQASLIHDLQREQTFQFKDIDSTKRALGAVALVSFEAYGVAVKVDSTVKVGRDRAGRRTAIVMEAASWIPFLSPFIRKPK